MVNLLYTYLFTILIEESTYFIDVVEIRNDGSILYIIKILETGDIINLNEIKAFWYRRGVLNLKNSGLLEFH
jgi:hypothetical protein